MKKLKDPTQVQFETIPGEMMTGTVFDFTYPKRSEGFHLKLDVKKGPE